MRLSTHRMTTVVLLAAFWHLNVFAHDAGFECRQIGDADARLKCYDAQVDNAPSGVRSSTADAAPSSPGATAKSTAGALPVPVNTGPGTEATFGLSATQLTKTPEAEASLTGKVAKVSGHPSHIGRWVVTLENGQVWEQRETTPANKRPRQGDTVVIEKGVLGSFVMTIRGRGKSSVKRIP